MELFIIIISSYLMGSIPFGYILTKIFLISFFKKILVKIYPKGIDPIKYENKMIKNNSIIIFYIILLH